MARRRSLTGWAFIAPAAFLIFVMNFWPMIQAFILSLKTGRGNNLTLAEPLWYNYTRLLHDDIFKQTLGNTLLYRDRNHITNAAAELLWPLLDQVVQPLMQR